MRMKLFSKRPPWYAAGLAFECTKCGQCCAGPHAGYVWVSDRDVAAIADFLGMTQQDVRRLHVRKVHGRLSIRERSGNNDCVFLGAGADGRHTCAIYPVRPVQCTTWPFWKTNLRSPGSWAGAGMRCPGINRGQIVPCDEIHSRADRTSE